MDKEIEVVDEDAMAAKGAILKDGTWVVEDGTVQVDAITKTVTDSYTFPLDISAALSDTDGSETLTIKLTDVPSDATLSSDNLTLVNNNDGTYSVTVPEGTTNLSDSLSITVPDGSSSFTLGLEVTASEDGETSTVTSSVSIDTPAGNSAPEAANDSVTTNEDSAYTFTTNDFGYSDSDGDTISSVQITTLPTTGSLTLDGVAVSSGDTIIEADITAGKLVFTPEENSDTNETISFKVSDGTAWSDTATTTINVDAVADAPTISATIENEITVAGAEGTAFGDTDTFNGTLDDWTGDGISNANGNELGIGNGATDETATKTFSFGSENANQEVTITFDVEFSSDVWESGSDYTDYFRVNLNDTQVYSDSDDTTRTITLTGTTDSNGDLKVDLITDTTATDEYVMVTNFSINGTGPSSPDTYQYDLNITNALTDDSESLGTVTVSGLPDGATLSAGSDNGDGTWSVAQNELSSLKLNTTSQLTGTESISLSVTSTDGTSTQSSAATAVISVVGDTLDYTTDLKDETVSTSNFNDTINVMSGTNDIEGNAIVNTNAGDDTINVIDDITGNTQIDTGTGNDTINVSDEVLGNAIINMGDGDDTLDIADDIQGDTNIDMGDGDDIIIVDDDIQGDSVIDMGSGDDQVKLTGDAGGDNSVIEENAQVDFGTGTDTLIMEDDITFDFEGLANQVKNLEVIDLQNTQAQTLDTINASDVIKMTDDDNVLKILGDDADQVGLDTDTWSKSDQKVTEEGETFDVWTNDNVTVYVDEDITVVDI